MIFSSLLCACPPAAAITTIPDSSCPEELGQIQKVIFQRLKDGATENKETFANAALLATWTAWKAAVDGTKIQASPFLSEPNNEPGAKREYGGGNATIGGIPINKGREASPFTAKILRRKQDVIVALKGYECESESRNLGVYLVDENGVIAGVEKTTGNVHPIPIQSFFVSDKGLGNFENVDYNDIGWSFDPNWSDNLKLIVPSDFDALNDV